MLFVYNEELGIQAEQRREREEMSWRGSRGRVAGSLVGHKGDFTSRIEMVDTYTNYQIDAGMNGQTGVGKWFLAAEKGSSCLARKLVWDLNQIPYCSVTGSVNSEQSWRRPNGCLS